MNIEYTPNFCFKTFREKEGKPYSLWLDGEVIAEYTRQDYNRGQALKAAKELMAEKIKSYTGERMPKWTIMQ